MDSAKKRPKGLRWLRYGKLGFWIAAAAFLFWLSWKNFVPGGELHIVYDVKEKSSLLTNFASKETNQIFLRRNDETFQKLTKSPVTFAIQAPRPFPEAEISLVYKNPDRQPLLQIGSERNPGSLTTLAFHDDRFDALEGVWSKIQDGMLTLWQQPTARSYGSVGEFLNNPPNRSSILEVNYHIERDYFLEGYEAASKLTTIGNSLRGSHTIVAYVGSGEPLEFRFLIQNSNLRPGKDTFRVTVTDGSRLVQEEIIDDFGNEEATGILSDERTMVIKRTDLRPGDYQVKIETSDDVLLKQIQSQQHLIMFKGKINFADHAVNEDGIDENVQSTALYSNGTNVSARAAHQKGFQTMHIGKSRVVLDTVGEKKEITQLKGKTKIQCLPREMLLTSDGYFAFSEEALYPLESSTANTLTDETNLKDFPYIIAQEVSQVHREGDWLVASATIRSPDLHFNSDNVAKLFFELPGFEEHDRSIEVKQIRVTLKKPPLTFRTALEKVKTKLKALMDE